MEAPTESSAVSRAGAAEVAGASRDDSFVIRLGAGDLLGIEVFGLPELAQEMRVGQDGRISMPLLGAVAVAGQTPVEAAEAIERLLVEKQLVNEPQVTVTIKDSVGSGVSVQGAVKKPGVYQLTGPKSLLELLLDAGGLSGGDNAADTIFVLRKDAAGNQSRTEISAEKLIGQGDMSANLALRPGDIVLVPEAKSYRVYVSGAVRSPGPVNFRSVDGITVLQAITAAGGPTERANLGKVQVIRRLPDGSEERFFVNVKRVRKGKLEDFALERNDTVVVDEWFF